MLSIPFLTYIHCAVNTILEATLSVPGEQNILMLMRRAPGANEHRGKDEPEYLKDIITHWS